MKDDADRRMSRALWFGMVLPLGLVGMAAVARACVQSDLRPYFNVGTLGGLGAVGFLAARWILHRGARAARAGWGVAVALYDTAMPLLVAGLVLLVDAAIPGR
jgi:hypothetical protein